MTMREILLAKLAVLIIRLLFLTIRVKMVDESGLLNGKQKNPVIIVFWHNRILGISAAFLKTYPQGRQGVTVLTSSSKDGEILAGIMNGLGMGAVRGSSSRRGARAIRELVRLIEEKQDIAITPDGPRGPKYTLSPGAVQLASLTGSPILLVHASYSRAVRMKTWDGFIIPLPFSTISVRIESEIFIPENCPESEFEWCRQNIEQKLKNGAD